MSGVKPSPEGMDDESVGVRDLIETVVLLGVGATSLTSERLRGIVDDLVVRGRLSANTAQALLERVSGRSRDRVGSGAERLDVEDIEFRLRQIEHRLRLLESRIDRCTGDRDS